MSAIEDVASGAKEEKSDGCGADYSVHRKVLDQLRLDEVAEKRTWSSRATVAEQVKESLR